MIYLDHAATTQPDPEVVTTMRRFLETDFGNPSSLHEAGRTAKKALEHSRQIVADYLDCEPVEIIFTSGGTESVNLAILGLASASNKKHIITTNIEHSAVLEACNFLESQGYQVTYLEADDQGLITADQVQAAITPETGLITIMYANNEVGTILPIPEIAAIAKQYNIAFHTDACQAAPYLDLSQLDITALSFSGSKIYGPRGAAVLYLKEDTPFQKQSFGGDQEHGFRAGTENLAAVAGLAKAVELLQTHREQDCQNQTELRDYLIQNLEGIKVNGHPKNRLPNNVNISAEGLEGESLLLRLNDKNIYVSTGSACSSAKLEASHVLEAIGLSKNDIHSSLRITLGRHTTKDQIDHFIQVFHQVVADLNNVGNWI